MLLPAPAVFALVQPPCVLRSSSVSLPPAMKGLHKLAEHLPPQKTHGLEVPLAAMQEFGSLSSVDGAGHLQAPGQHSPLPRARCLPGTCCGAVPLPLALGHPDECRGQLLVEVSHALCTP